MLTKTFKILQTLCAVYGLEVARGMDMGDEFINYADKIRRRLTNISKESLENTQFTKSNYNSEIIKNKCDVCNDITIDIDNLIKGI